MSRGSSVAAPGLAPALLFFLAPALILTIAVVVRARGEIATPETIINRLSEFVPQARESAAAEGVPLPLVLAVASVESSGIATARSPAGAVGLMQLMPATAEEMATLRREPPPDRTDPTTSLRLGSRYLARARRRYASHPRVRELALAAYNAGQGNVSKWTAAAPPPVGYEDLVSWIRIAETRAYVRRVTVWEQRWHRVLAAELTGPADPPE